MRLDSQTDLPRVAAIALLLIVTGCTSARSAGDVRAAHGGADRASSGVEHMAALQPAVYTPPAVSGTWSSSPILSPDGRAVAWDAGTRDGAQIYLRDASGTHTLLAAEVPLTGGDRFVIESHPRVLVCNCSPPCP